ncbi:MAG: hypothetical protein ABWK00_00200 [Desulfurococcaceae archaeon]
MKAPSDFPGTSARIAPRRLSREFHEFLTALLTYEASGLRLDNVMLQAAQGKLWLPRSFVELSRFYLLFYTTSQDPLEALRKLSKAIRGVPRLSDFLRGYTEVLLASGDTVRYVEQVLREELQERRSRLEEILKFVEAAYEAYVILIVSVISFTIFPTTSLSVAQWGFVISVTSAALALLLKGMTSILYLPTRTEFSIAELLIVLTAPLAFLSIYVLLLHIFLSVGVLLVINAFYRRLERADRAAVDLVEELFTGARLGIPVDVALIKAMSNTLPQHKLLLWSFSRGIDSSKILSRSDLPPFTKFVLRMLLNQIDYVRDHVRYTAYIARAVNLIRELRSWLRGKALTFTVYSLLLPALMIATYRLMRAYRAQALLLLSASGASALCYVSFVGSFIIGTAVTQGGAYTSWREIVLYAIVSLLSTALFLT